MGLWLTFLLGIFIILGAVIVFFSENNEKFIEFSIALASSVIFMLVILELIPEIMECSLFKGWLQIFAIFAGVGFGFVLLLVLDKFIPDHEDDPTTDEYDHKNLEHIGWISSIALILHNIVEGMAIYMLANSEPKAAFLASIGVGLHNIPLGMVITSAFYQQNENRKKTLLMISIVALSTFLGGLIIFLFQIQNYVEILEFLSLTLTIGMLLFILIKELLPKVKKSNHPKISGAGLLTGIVLLLITTLF